MKNTRYMLEILSITGRLIRFPTASFSLILPLLGAALTSIALTGFQICGLLIVAMAFHIFAYVLNDVIDLPVDRTEPLRAEYPLVQGIVRPWQALLLALLQIPLALLVTAWFGGNASAYLFLAAAFLAMAIYDLWGKRLRFPLLTDLVQGVGWSALLAYGAASVGGQPSARLGVAVVFIVVFILMINGVHGGLRDLANDLRCQASTTAIFLGARPLEDGVRLSLRFQIYALALQLSLFALLLLPLVYNWFGYEAATRGMILAGVTLFSLVSLLALIFSALSTRRLTRLLFFGTLHIVLSLNILLLACAPLLSARLLLVLLLAYFVPLCNIVWYWLRQLYYTLAKLKTPRPGVQEM